MKLGIIGPNVGKSTLMPQMQEPRLKTILCTIDPNVGIVAVPDERLLAAGRDIHLRSYYFH